MVPVTTVYDPQRRKYFSDGLHILVDCSRAALEVYSKRKGINYRFSHLGSKAFCQEFEHSKNWKVFTISFLAYIFTKDKLGGDEYFGAKVFCAPKWDHSNFIFHVLEVDLIKYVDPRFHHVSLLAKEPPFFISNIHHRALVEYNKSKGSDYNYGLIMTEKHPSSVLLYGGNASSWLYTVRFHAQLIHSGFRETFLVKALIDDGSLVAFLEIKKDEVAGSSVGVEIE